jgi:hypothetical protein
MINLHYVFVDRQDFCITAGEVAGGARDTGSGFLAPQ